MEQNKLTHHVRFKSLGSKSFLVRLERQFNLTIRPSTMTKLSLMTLAKGAKQLVVQEALLVNRGEISQMESI